MREETEDNINSKHKLYQTCNDSVVCIFLSQDEHLIQFTRGRVDIVPQMTDTNL